MITDEVDSEEKEEAYLFQEVKGTKFETAEDDTRRFSPIRRSVCSFFFYHPGVCMPRVFFNVSRELI